MDIIKTYHLTMIYNPTIKTLVFFPSFTGVGEEKEDINIAQ